MKAKHKPVLKENYTLKEEKEYEVALFKWHKKSFRRYWSYLLNKVGVVQKRGRPKKKPKAQRWNTKPEKPKRVYRKRVKLLTDQNVVEQKGLPN